MLVPLTDYGLSKLMGERLSQAFAQQYGLEYTVWRPFNIIGLHERAEGYDPGVCHVFADFIQRIVHEKQNPMLVLGTGEQVRCFTWIGDVARGIAQWSFDPATANQDFNLGNREPVTMIDLAQRIYRIYYQMIGQEPAQELSFKHGETFTDDVQVRIPSVDKAKDRLGWEVEVKLDEMLHRCLAHELEQLPVGAGAALPEISRRLIFGNAHAGEGTTVLPVEQIHSPGVVSANVEIVVPLENLGDAYPTLRGLWDRVMPEGTLTVFYGLPGSSGWLGAMSRHY